MEIFITAYYDSNKSSTTKKCLLFLFTAQKQMQKDMYIHLQNPVNKILKKLRLQTVASPGDVTWLLNALSWLIMMII